MDEQVALRPLNTAGDETALFSDTNTHPGATAVRVAEVDGVAGALGVVEADGAEEWVTWPEGVGSST